MTTSMVECKRRLATLWFSGAAVLFVVLLVQSIFGRYGSRTSDAWSWLLPTLMPTLSLVIGVLVMDSLGKGVMVKRADKFLFKLTSGMSVVYLVAVLLIFVLQPLSPVGPFELMGQSSLWLGPFQGLVAGAMGAFFVKAPDEAAKEPAPTDTTAKNV